MVFVLMGTLLDLQKLKRLTYIRGLSPKNLFLILVKNRFFQLQAPLNPCDFMVPIEFWRRRPLPNGPIIAVS